MSENTTTRQTGSWWLPVRYQNCSSRRVALASHSPRGPRCWCWWWCCWCCLRFSFFGLFCFFFLRECVCMSVHACACACVRVCMHVRACTFRLPAMLPPSQPPGMRAGRARHVFACAQESCACVCVRDRSEDVKISSWLCLPGLCILYILYMTALSSRRYCQYKYRFGGYQTTNFY